MSPAASTGVEAFCSTPTTISVAQGSPFLTVSDNKGSCDIGDKCNTDDIESPIVTAQPGTVSLIGGNVQNDTLSLLPVAESVLLPISSTTVDTLRQPSPQGKPIDGVHDLTIPDTFAEPELTTVSTLYNANFQNDQCLRVPKSIYTMIPLESEQVHGIGKDTCDITVN